MREFQSIAAVLRLYDPGSNLDDAQAAVMLREWFGSEEERLELVSQYRALTEDNLEDWQSLASADLIDQDDLHSLSDLKRFLRQVLQDYLGPDELSGVRE
ncbi:MAG: hypothetical protein AAFZ18_36510 [Myxococcota bacterium]